MRPRLAALRRQLHADRRELRRSSHGLDHRLTSPSGMSALLGFLQKSSPQVGVQGAGTPREEKQGSPLLALASRCDPNDLGVIASREPLPRTTSASTAAVAGRWVWDAL